MHDTSPPGNADALRDTLRDLQAALERRLELLVDLRSGLVARARYFEACRAEEALRARWEVLCAHHARPASLPWIMGRVRRRQRTGGTELAGA